MTLTPVWHPVSTLLLDDPRCYATPQMVKMLLMAGSTRLIYVGDAMWPSIPSGATLTLAPPTTFARGDVVSLVDDGGFLIAARVAGTTEAEVSYLADADPAGPWICSRSAVVGIVRSVDPSAQDLGKVARTFRRIRCDALEALAGPDAAPDDARPDEGTGPIDLAQSVRAKYDEQAPHYLTLAARSIPPGVLERIAESVRDGGEILVVGSGVGRECFELAAAGWTVTGIDFSGPMVRLARKQTEAQPQAVREAVSFVQADLRSWAPDRSYDGIFFTFDVYSFVPTRTERVAALIRLSEALAAEGTIFLSARRMRGIYERTIHGYAHLRGKHRKSWGASHTRYVDHAGTLRRAFIQVFERGQLRREIRAAGLRAGDWHEAYCELTHPYRSITSTRILPVPASSGSSALATMVPGSDSPARMACPAVGEAVNRSPTRTAPKPASTLA